VQVVEGEAAPGSAENAKPRDAVLGVEQGAGESDGIADLGAVMESFEIDGAEGNGRFAEGLGDGYEGFAGAGEDSDAVFLADRACYFHRREMALNEVSDLLGLGFLEDLRLKDATIE
jgi:ribosomal protein S12 methylthiotransferase accessory factor YcaO